MTTTLENLREQRAALELESGSYVMSLKSIKRKDTAAGKSVLLTFGNEGGQVFDCTWLIQADEETTNRKKMTLDNQIKLLTMLEAVTGQGDTGGEPMMQALQKAVGTPLQIEVKRTESDGRYFYDVVSFAPAPGGDDEAG